MQLQALNRAGCMAVFKEHISGAAKRRPQLDLAIMSLQEGDTLVVWRLDRLARSMRQLLSRLDDIVAAGAKLKSLTEEIDISTAVGRLMLTFLGGFAEFERALTIERTKAGIQAAQARGVRFGRKKTFTDDKQRKVLAMLKAGKMSNRDIARKMKISESLLYKFVREHNAARKKRREK